MIITVAYVSKTGDLFLEELTLLESCTIFQALLHSSIFNRLGDELTEFNHWLHTTTPDTPPHHKRWFVGVFSQKKPLNYLLQNGDRLEIYRPLTLDPMKTRQTKVNRAKKEQARLRSIPRINKINKNKKIN